MKIGNKLWYFTKYALKGCVTFKLLLEIQREITLINSDPSAHICLSHMHCLMVMVLCKLNKIERHLLKLWSKNLKCLWNNRMTESRACWKLYPSKPWVKRFNLPILTADLSTVLVAVLLLDIVLLSAVVMVFADSGSPMDVKLYRPPRIGLIKHKATLKITLLIIQEQLKYNSSKLH